MKRGYLLAVVVAVVVFAVMLAGCPKHGGGNEGMPMGNMMMKGPGMGGPGMGGNEAPPAETMNAPAEGNEAPIDNIAPPETTPPSAAPADNKIPAPAEGGKKGKKGKK